MNERARRSPAIGARLLLFLAGSALLATGRMARPGARAPDVPLAPPIDDGHHHVVELEAQRVDLSHTGAHTHANWVIFELPFAVNDPTIRKVSFRQRTLVDSNVGALHFAFVCLPAPPTEPHSFTVNGAGHTSVLATHPYAPTFDARAYAINVPTRVANAAACGDAAPLLQR